MGARKMIRKYEVNWIFVLMDSYCTARLRDKKNRSMQLDSWNNIDKQHWSVWTTLSETQFEFLEFLCGDRIWSQWSLWVPTNSGYSRFCGKRKGGWLKGTIKVKTKTTKKIMLCWVFFSLNATLGGVAEVVLIPRNPASGIILTNY